MTIKEACEKRQQAVEVLGNIALVRSKLIGKPLTAELFAELNGDNYALETLLKRDVFADFSDANQMATLRRDILAAMESEEIECNKLISAALECFRTDLIEACNKYDAHADKVLAERATIKDKVKELSEDALNKFLLAKTDFLCFTFSNAEAICEYIAEFGRFLDSEDCKLKLLVDISTRQGGDMTETDNQFLDKLNSVLRELSNKQRSFIWHAIDDRIEGAQVQRLGFDAKKLATIADKLTKAENVFYKTVRAFREALGHEATPVDDVAIVNSKFDETMWNITGFIDTMGRARSYLSDQISLMVKLLVSVTVAEPPPASEDTDDDQGDKKDDESAPELNQEDEPKESGEVPTATLGQGPRW